MIRRLASVFGSVVLAFAGVTIVVSGRDAFTDPITAVTLAGLVLAAVLSITGSLVDSIAIGRQTVRWNGLVGTANIVLSIAVVLSTVRTAVVADTASSWLVAAAMVAGGGSVSVQGRRIARGNRHIDLDPIPASRQLVVVSVLGAGLIGSGLLVATNA